MKKSPLLIAAGGCLIAASLLIPLSSDAPATTATIASSHPTKVVKRVISVAEQIGSRPARPAGEEDANLAAWRARYETLLSEHGDPDRVASIVLEEIGASYQAWVTAELAPIADRPATERYDELADVERSLNEGTQAILDELGVAEEARLGVAVEPAEALAAEVQYAEAARDSASRLALLRLDRERQGRLEAALAITNEAVKAQSLVELDAWYESGMGAIFATNDPNEEND